MTNETISIADLRRDPDRLLRQVELCTLLGKSKAWAERHRWAKTGPAFHKIGRSVAYQSRDVLAWLERRRVETEAA